MPLKKSISSIFFVVTLLLLGVSLVVHVSLYAGFNTRDQIPGLWTCLQYAIVIGFIPKSVSYLSMGLGITKRPPPYVWGSAKYEEQSTLKTYGEMAAGVMIVIVCLYAIMSPIHWYVIQLNQWTPYALDGQYFAYFKTGGTKVRSLTPDEFKVMSSYFARATSSHWLACHSIALAVLYGDKATRVT